MPETIVKQQTLDLTDRLTLEQAEYQFKTARDEGKFDLLAIGEDKNKGGFMVFKCFPHSLIEKIGFTIIKKNEIKK